MVLNVVLLVLVKKSTFSPTLLMFSQSKSALVCRLTGGWEVDGDAYGMDVGVDVC